MWGLFKKRVTPTEFGHGVLGLAKDWIASDAGQSLGMRFENFDGSEGWAVFLERKGLPLSLQKLHLRLYAHCAVQAAAFPFGRGTAHEMTQGAMSGFVSIGGYDFDTTYRTLDAAYGGRRRFAPMLEPLTNPDAQLSFLSNSNIGVLNAKYLIENFILSNLNNHVAFIDDFLNYSSTVSATVATVRRSMDQLFKSFKIS